MFIYNYSNIAAHLKDTFLQVVIKQNDKTQSDGETQYKSALAYKKKHSHARQISN